MTTEDIVKLLTQLDRRLATIVDQARETREQAQHTLDRLERLRKELDRLRLSTAASSDTSDHIPIIKDKGE